MVRLFVKFHVRTLTSAGADFDGDGTLDGGYHMGDLGEYDDGNMDGIVEMPVTTGMIHGQM
ncbi:MAG: hypothetical protein IPN89_10855 [Saprospiraceae bacterium]|nr:hypothetical protein [Saprospiraceae bacterium]